jgi:hypothetical protein
MSKVQLHGLSRKADETRRTYLVQAEISGPRVFPLRKKEEDMSHFKSPVKQHQATAVNHAAITRKGAYTIGDGDFGGSYRTGADDHLKYKSLSSEGVANYKHRGHK